LGRQRILKRSNWFTEEASMQNFNRTKKLILILGLKTVRVIALTAIIMLAISFASFAGMIFSENYDSISSGWQCSNAVPNGWTNLTACTSRNYGGILHYGGEITSGGRSGNSLKQWKAPGTNESGYNGYINYVFNSTQFNNHYRTLYSRVYVKFPLELNATGCAGACPKLMGRMYGGTSAGSTTKEVYLNITGNTMKTSTFQIVIDGATPPFDSIYSTKTAASYGIFDGKWHAIELGVSAGTSGQADGQIHLYIDGTEVQLAGGSGESPAIGQTKVAFNWAPNVYITAPLVPGVGNLSPESSALWASSDNKWHAIEWDDFVVSTTYIGPSNGGSNPTINTVAGSVATGQTLNISGANLVQENNSNWDNRFKAGTVYSFEGTNLAADSSVYANTAGVYDSSIKLLGNKSIKFSVSGARTGLYPDNGGSANYFNETANDYWFRAYVRYNVSNGAWPDNYTKLFIMQGTPTNYYIQFAMNGGNAPREMLIYDGGNDVYYASLPYQVQNNCWYLIEGHIRSTSPTVFDLWFDGQKLFSNQTPSTMSPSFINFGPQTYGAANSSFSMDNWIDGMTVSSSRVYPASNIEISGDGLTWKYQEPVYLSDTSAQIKVNLSGLTGTNYRLRVTNNQQQMSNIYTLSSSTPALKAPADFKTK
jgi:hypothetical protein